MIDYIVGMAIGAVVIALGVKKMKEHNATLDLSGGARRSPREKAREDGFVGDEAEVMALIAQNKKLDAIKVVREMTGLDLKTSKELVDRMAKGHAVDLAAKTHSNDKP